MKAFCILAAMCAALVGASAAPAQPIAAREQSAAEALAQDARQYAGTYGVSLEEAMARLRAQEESVAATDALRTRFADRLAGIAVEHEPAFRIVLLLTGDDPVPDEMLSAGGMTVPVVFHTGAAATHDQMVAGIRDRAEAIRTSFPMVQGLGVDQKAGDIVASVRAGGIDAHGPEALRLALAEALGAPVRLRAVDRQENLALGGGARVEGVQDGRRFACTTGFVVTDGARSGLVTAAHCPYTLTYLDQGQRTPLSFVGAWGARYQDVQVQASAEPLQPVFYADTAKAELRTLASWRNRASTRAGDVVCHRGERSGYSCAEVELVDYAPMGPLCGGACEPSWVTVAGPTCKSGDSGGPVFSGGVAFGIVKGGSYRKDGGCNFYFYMSTDYLPQGWTLAHR